MKLKSIGQFTEQFAIFHLMGVEGEVLTNIKGDRGGKTNFGIIEKTFLEPEFKPLRDKFNIHRIEDVTKEFAYAFYKFGWWDRLRLEEVRAINPLIAERLLDIGVNGGRGTGVIYLQRIINLFNDNQKLYPDIAVDGGMGPGTLGALRKLVEVRKNDPNVFKNIVLQMYILQGAQWFNQAEKDKTQEKFSWGWSNRAANSIDDFYKLL